MKFTLSWLREHLQTEASLDRMTTVLSSIGLEVESVADPAAALAPFRTARIIEALPHPNADRLRVCTVDLGAGEPVRVVCGAPNARTGLHAVFAPPGAFIPGSGITLKIGEIRGVTSAGMLVSSREMALGDEHDGIVELPEGTPVGLAYAGWAGLDDPVIEIGVTPNRGDALSVRGVARDLGAAGLGVLKPVDGRTGRFGLPDAACLVDRLAAGVPLGARARYARGSQRAEPGLAAAATARHRAAPDQRIGGHHEFLHHRSRPPAACVRLRAARRRSAGAPPRCRRDFSRAQRSRCHRRQG